MTYEGKITAQLGRETELEPPLFLPDGKGLLFIERGDAGRRLILSDFKGKETRTVVEGFANVFVLPLRDNRIWRIITCWRRWFWPGAGRSTKRDHTSCRARWNELWPLASNADVFVYAARNGERWSLRAVKSEDGKVQELDAGAFAGYPSAFFLPDGRQGLYEARGQFSASAPPCPTVRRFSSTKSTVVSISRTRRSQPELVYDNAFLLAASLVR